MMFLKVVGLVVDHIRIVQLVVHCLMIESIMVERCLLLVKRISTEI